MKKKGIFISLGIVLVIIVLIVLFFVLRVKTSKDEALNIACDYASINKKQIKYKEIDSDYIEGYYDVEINDGFYEYSLEINMRTGKVSEFSKEAISNSKVSGAKENIISEDAAKKIALDHAELTNNDVVFTKVYQEYDDGLEIYDIEFIYNNREYEYEINAVTSEIIKFEK